MQLYLDFPVCGFLGASLPRFPVVWRDREQEFKKLHEFACGEGWEPPFRFRGTPPPQEQALRKGHLTIGLAFLA